MQGYCIQLDRPQLKKMRPENFIESYEAALATQKWSEVEPLISDDACVTFSNGAVHLGKDKVQMAFERNFDKIKSEKYVIDNVKWIKKENDYAVYVFEFNWRGILDGKSVFGNGVGTSAIINENGKWKLLIEHLGKK